ncbi:BAG family molecular chaperone regulator 2-like isoform X2 [Corticium candelabrum]|uniref:BAG family molecular chaperone regulator 2-like isoform X2 n=1 Tax=Corticium candelabrum TaxID=121492 RepID=UPI002E26A1C5|nr:BAG family molecular chaperone regulator 2-like isoform X2 [Corticium candelabrum]
MSSFINSLHLMRRFTSLGGSPKDQITALLDDIEFRVEKIRETAVQMEDGKEQLLQTLCELHYGVDMNKLSEVDKEELKLTAERVRNRCLTISVQVETIRSKEQESAWQAISKVIKELADKSEVDVNSTHKAAVACYNACLSDPPSNAIDCRFQGMLLDCCVEDQKRVRSRLLQLIEDTQAVNRLEGTRDGHICTYPSLSETARRKYDPNKPLAIGRSSEASDRKHICDREYSPDIGQPRKLVHEDSDDSYEDDEASKFLACFYGSVQRWPERLEGWWTGRTATIVASKPLL